MISINYNIFSKIQMLTVNSLNKKWRCEYSPNNSLFIRLLFLLFTIKNT